MLNNHDHCTPIVASHVLRAWAMPHGSIYDAIVIGAGQSGLAAGYYLQRSGLSFLIMDASEQPEGSWPHYYDSLTLFSPARHSSLLGLRFPGSPEHYPRRDEVSAYLRSYAQRFRLPIVRGARADAVQRTDGLFRISAGGQRYNARAVVAATGSFCRPFLPQLPGQSTYRGRILHAASYRNPEPFQGRRVVVGGGNSAVQIAVELARHASVTLATRRPIRFTPQRVLGRDIFVWLSLTRLERLPLGRWITLHEPDVVLDTGVYCRAIAAGAPPRRPMFDAFSRDGVIWPGGEHEAVDAVLFATGYRPNLDYLRPLGALDAAGAARQRAGVSSTTPGLYFLGLQAQRTLASATLRGVGADARYVVEHIRSLL